MTRGSILDGRDGRSHYVIPIRLKGKGMSSGNEWWYSLLVSYTRRNEKDILLPAGVVLGIECYAVIGADCVWGIKGYRKVGRVNSKYLPILAAIFEVNSIEESRKWKYGR